MKMGLSKHILNRKVLLVLLVLGLLYGTVEAKTIHWLTFIDTTDPDVGKIDGNTRNLLYSKWIEVVNSVLKEDGYSINTVDIYGKELSPDTCKTIVESIQIEPSDIIVFYYVGHGIQNVGVSEYPRLCLGQRLENKLLALSWIHDKLKFKKPRLAITIGMCCNSKQLNIQGAYEPRFGISFDSRSIITRDKEAAIRKMFLNYKGDLIVTSASPNESSYATMSSNMGASDYFSLNLIEAFENINVSNKKLSWNSVLDTIKNSVLNDVENDAYIQSHLEGATQTPMWSMNLTAAEAPTVTRMSTPAVFSAYIDEDYAIKSKLNNMFAYISSENVDKIERINKAKEYRKQFANNLRVKILPEFGDIVIDKESIDSYLTRISTTRKIAHTSIVDFDVNSEGMVCKLVVREIVKQK
jgi:hypothetical protein